MQIGLDTLAATPFGGSVVQQLSQGGFNINSLRTNATLRKDEWQMLDRAIIEVARIRLRAVNDLLSRGLRFTVDGMRTTVLQWQTQSRTEEVNVSMDAQAMGRSEAVNFEIANLPLPIFHADYTIGARELGISRVGGAPLDTIIAAQKSMDIAEKVENTLVNGLSTYAYGGGNIYGYTDQPARNTLVETLAERWDLPAVTGEAIVTMVKDMKQLNINAKKYGPFILYIPTAYETKMDCDYSTLKGTNTVRERILALANVDEVKVLDTLAADNVLLVQLTPDVVRMVDGMPMTNVQWGTKGEMLQNFKIMTIMIPQFRVDQDNNSGVCHLTFA